MVHTYKKGMIMDRSMIISKTRVEIRRKMNSFQKERAVISWIQQFFDEMSIDHSSQVRHWQQEAFLSKLKNKHGLSKEDLLQARSALLFMNSAVLGKSRYSTGSIDLDTEPGVFRITA